MLEDIMNINRVSRKRSIDTNSPYKASLLNLVTGSYHLIHDDIELEVGRALSSSIIIEESYISRIHFFIKFNGNKYILKDSSNSGTFLNCVKIPFGKNIELNHGDIIGVGEKNNFKFNFKFLLNSYSGKNPRLGENFIETSLVKLRSENLQLKEELTYARKTYQSEGAELKEKIKTFETAYATLQHEVNNRSLQPQLNLKNQIQDLLENELQCPICNEIMVKAVSSNCHHSFCDSCLSEWFKKNGKKICPVCRVGIKTTTKSLAIDTYITKTCDLLGGTFKEQRDNVLKERSDASIPKKKNGKKKPFVINTIALPPLVPYNPVYLPNPNIVAIVDLTNSSSM